MFLAAVLVTPFILISTALPAPEPQSSAPPGFPGSTSANATSTAETNITYYQGTVTADSCGSVAVASGSLNASTCFTFHTYSVAIGQVPGDECSLTLYKGSATCGTDVEKAVVTVPAGIGETCVVSGVLDGGLRDKASGVWDCV